MSYSKLHSSLVNSSLWTEPDSVRILFITLLAMCDRQGYVYGSRSGLERLANIEPGDAEGAWVDLMSPDPDSSDRLRNPENEGRRIEEVAGGFRLLNFEYYRSLRNDDDRREQTRLAQARHRSKIKSARVSQDKPKSSDESQREQIPSASASVSDSAWLEELSKDKAYRGIGVLLEHAKMVRWCKERKRQPTRRTFINWLNRSDRILDGSNQKLIAESRRNIGTSNEGKSEQYKGVGQVH